MSKISDITLVNLPSTFLEDPMQTYPLGILNIATSIRNSGYKIDLLDLVPLIKDSGKILNLQILSELRKVRSPIVGVSVTTPQSRFLPLFSIVYKRKRLVAGGPHIAVAPEELLNYGFDVIVSGEGETVIDRIMGAGDFGFCKAEPVKDLDTFPFPDRSFFSGYKGAIPVMASRGCPYNCSFCSTTLDKKVRFRSPENVVEEIKEISVKYPGKDEIIFYDDDLLQNFKFVERLCYLLRQERLHERFRFKCSARVDKISMDIAELLEFSGFEEIKFGVESGSQKILDILNKKTTIRQNTLAMDICRKVGLKFSAFIMIGSPGETFETLIETEEWLTKNKPDIKLYMYHPLPGSDIWDNSEKYDIGFDKLEYDRSFYGGHRESMFSTVSTSTLTRFEITRFYYHLLEKFDLWRK